MYSAVLIVDLIGPPITYATLKHSLWLPYLVCALALLLTYPVLARMPETLQRSEPSENRPIFSKSNIMDYKKFFQSWNIMIGVATVFLAQFRVNTIEILLPYTSVRFGLELGEVKLSNPSALENSKLVSRLRRCYPSCRQLISPCFYYFSRR